MSMLHLIRQMVYHPMISYYRWKYKDVEDLATLPIGTLLNVAFHQKELNSWNTIAAMIDYTFPTENLALYKNNDELINSELRYCIKYAAYIYFMNIIRNPLSIKIEAKDKYLPFSCDVNEAGYFIGIDDNTNDEKQFKCILLCIRGTSTIGECITDLCAHSVEKQFGKKKYNVHHGIYETAKWIDRKVRGKIIKYSEQFPDYKILVTGHSLGAGVCSLLGLLWKSQDVFDDNKISYYSFASPLIVDYNGRRESINNKNNNMISVAVATDIVTRLSIKGVVIMNERMKIIQKYLDNSGGIINNIVKKRCCSNNIEEFHNKLSQEENELIAKLRPYIPQSITDDMKDENNNEETGDNFLYPCGKLLWFVPEFLMDDNVNTEGKYRRLKKLINWQIQPNALIQALQFIDNIIRDFYKYTDNVILTTLKSAAPFTEMVYNGDESFDAHFPGRYLHCFDLSLSDIFEMSSIYHTLKKIWQIPQFLLTWLILLIFILNYLIKTSIRYLRNLFCNQQKHRHS